VSSKGTSIKLIVFGLLTWVLSACTVPTAPLTKNQRTGDVSWVFSTFDNYYAPLEYKKTLGIDYEAIKKDCLAKAEPEQSNDEFRALLYECINRFRDAHTAGSQIGVAMPNKGTVAYLGFRTRRAAIDAKVTSMASGEKVQLKGLAIEVKSLLPTTKAEDFAIKARDLIVMIDGKPVADILKAELLPQINIGQEQAALTVASAVFPLRSSWEYRVPAASTVTLGVVRDHKLFDVTLPWVKQDLYYFTNDLKIAQLQQDSQKKKDKKDDPGDDAKKKPVFSITSGDEKYDINSRFAQALQSSLFMDTQAFMSVFNDSLNRGAKALLEHTFRVVRPSVLMSAVEFRPEEVNRSLPEGAIDVSNKSWFAYELEVPLVDKDGKATGEKDWIGYIRIHSFDIGDPNLGQYVAILKEFNRRHIKRVIIDTLDNLGGSLTHGLRMANLLTTKSVEYPQMQLGLNSAWLDAFNNEATYGTTPSDREWSRRIFDDLYAQAKSGQRLSKPISALALDPDVNNFPKTDALPADSKIVVLINEMCVSMCDIFAAVVKDNKLATLMGTQTMGGGGNIVNHYEAPGIGIHLSQTQSLILRKDGTYIENHGIEPDVAVDTYGQAAGKYESVLAKAIEALSKKD